MVHFIWQLDILLYSPCGYLPQFKKNSIAIIRHQNVIIAAHLSNIVWRVFAFTVFTFHQPFLAVPSASLSKCHFLPTVQEWVKLRMKGVYLGFILIDNKWPGDLCATAVPY